jgi:hypothetical protein
MCESFLEPHHVASRRGYRAMVVLGSAEWGRLGLTIGPGGPQRLLILCGNPPPKAAGSFSLLPWGRANDRTLCGGTSPGGGPRRGDALAFLPQGEMTFGFREDGPGATDWVPGAVYACRCAGPLSTRILIDVKSPDKRFCGATARTPSKRRDPRLLAARPPAKRAVVFWGCNVVVSHSAGAGAVAGAGRPQRG